MTTSCHFQESLESNVLQLRQVEAALTLDPSNAELLHLKYNLEQVISLMKQLLDPSTSCSFNTTTQPSSDGTSHQATLPASSMDNQTGDQGPARSSIDRQYHEATENGVDQVGESVGAAMPQLAKKSDGGGVLCLPQRSQPDKRRRMQREKQRRHKRIQFYQRLEEKHEAGKNRWQAFLHCNKVVKKAAAKSIFASPETEGGRIGIGTCGRGGRPMTEYRAAIKPTNRKW